MPPHHAILISLSFFTRLPFGRFSPPMDSVPLSQLVWAFPIAGAVIGAFSAAAYALLLAIGLAPLMAGILTVAFQLWVTGGLHEDGLADTADGFAGGYTTQSRLRIMKDSSIGSFGALALIITLSLRFYAMMIVQFPFVLAAFFIASGALSRAMIAVGMYALPGARADGLANWAGRPTQVQLAVSLLLACLMTLALLQVNGLYIILLALALGGATCWLSKRKIGGITGDVYGAIQQVVETGIMVAATILIVHT